MTKRMIGSLFSLIAISTLTIGCGSSSSTEKTITQSKGNVIDDYIQGATVCVDAAPSNGIYEADKDKPCAKGLTDKYGGFTFATDVSTSPLVMSGGTDVGTGKPFTGTLTAPAGSTVVNPLTTLVQAMIASGSKNVVEAQKAVKISLGINPKIDLNTYDPLAALGKKGATASEKEIAKKVFAQQNAIQTILTTVSKTIAKVSGKKESDVTQGAATEIAKLMLTTPTPKVVNINSKDSVKTIITQTAKVASTTDTNVTIPPALVEAIAKQVETTSQEMIKRVENSDEDSSVGEIRQVAAQVAYVVQNNADTLAEETAEVVAETKNLNDVITSVVSSTNQLATAIASAGSQVTQAGNLETVAPSSTSGGGDTLTGAQGGN